MKSIYILGSLNKDLTLYLPRFVEVGETLAGSSFQSGNGGKGLNQAIAAARLGGRIHFLGAIGNDSFGRELRQALILEGIDISDVYERQGAPSGVALIEVVGKDNRIGIAPGANLTISPREIDHFLASSQAGDLFLFQGENNVEAWQYALRKAKDRGLKVIVNPAPVQPAILDDLDKVDVLIPNENEFQALCPNASLEDANKHLLVPSLIVTLGVKGYFLDMEGVSFIRQSEPLPTIDTSGAGDAFVGSLSYFLAQDLDIIKALDLANMYAGLSTTRKGTSISYPSRDEFLNFLKGRRPDLAMKLQELDHA